MSTRAVGAPLGMTGQGTGQQVKVVPLSVFFLNMQADGEGDPENGFQGRKKKSKKKPKTKNNALNTKDSGGIEPTVGGDAEQAAKAGQSTASESATMSTGTPLLAPTKTGATRASSGSMGSGNVAQYHIPIGGMLRRTSPVGAVTTKKKKKKSKRERGRWIERLVQT